MTSPSLGPIRRWSWAAVCGPVVFFCGCSPADESGGAVTTAGTSSAAGTPNNGGGGQTSSSAGQSGTTAGAGGGADGLGGVGSSASLGGAGGNAGGAGTSAAGGTPGSAGAGGAAGASSSCNGALFCDDFEAYQGAPAGPWTVTKQGNGTVTVDTTHAKSGTKAAHFHGTPNGDVVYMAAKSAPVLPVTGGDTLFVRYLLYVDAWATPASGQPMHERLAWVGSAEMMRNAADSGYTFATYNGIAIERINSGYYRDTSQAMDAASNNLKQWVCWEFELDNKGGPIAGAGGTFGAHIWRNDKELSLKVAGSQVSWNPVPWNMLQFSLFTYQPSTVAVDFWLDDVAMSKTKIGCPK